MRKPRGGLCAGQNVDTVQPAKIGKENKHYFSQERIRSRLMVGIKLSTKQLMYKTDHRPRERGPPPPHTIGPPHVIILFRFVQPMGKETRSARLPVKHISHHPGRAATTDNSVFDRITFWHSPNPHDVPLKNLRPSLGRQRNFPRKKHLKRCQHHTTTTTTASRIRFFNLRVIHLLLRNPIHFIFIFFKFFNEDIWWRWRWSPESFLSQICYTTESGGEI